MNEEAEEIGTMEKIEWLIDNEGCELADGYDALGLFFQYCCTEDDSIEILSIISEEVDFQYQIVMSQQDEEDDWQDDRVINIVNSIWDDLKVDDVFSADDKEQLKEKWATKLKKLL